MVKNIIVGTTMIALFVFLFAGLSTAEDFAADVINRVGSGTSEGKIFVTKDKVRMETPESIMITRLDKKIVWILVPAEKMYMEQPLGARDTALAAPDMMPGEIERTLVAAETVGQTAADKYKIVYAQNASREAVYQWIERDSRIPVKTEAIDGSWSVEYRNIKKAAQPDSLFELPSDYQKMSVQMPVLPGGVGEGPPDGDY